MPGQSFRDAERTGWDHKAGFWDNTLGAVTREAIGPLLDAVGAAPGIRLLDIACATGALVAAAAERGAEPIGMDIAPSMIELAVRQNPGVEFHVGDAEAIPLPDGSLDAVTCSFGLMHMERPDHVLAEIARVLRPGTGRFAATAWAPQGDLFTLVGQAVQAHADMAVPLPAAPPFFRLADEETCRSELHAAGFVEVGFQHLPLAWTGSGPEAVLDLLFRGTVRTPMLIEAQAPAVRAAIERAIIRGAERHTGDRGVVLQWPVLLTMARRG